MGFKTVFNFKCAPKYAALCSKWHTSRVATRQAQHSTDECHLWWKRAAAEENVAGSRQEQQLPQLQTATVATSARFLIVASMRRADDATRETGRCQGAWGRGWWKIELRGSLSSSRSHVASNLQQAHFQFQSCQNMQQILTLTVMEKSSGRQRRQHCHKELQHQQQQNKWIDATLLLRSALNLY